MHRLLPWLLSSVLLVLLLATTAAPTRAALSACDGDFNQNGVVDAADLATIATVWREAAAYDQAYDLYPDGRIDVLDLLKLATLWDQPCVGPPPLAIRVNVGGRDYTAGDSTLWAADRAYTAGSWGYFGTSSVRSTTQSIANTDDDPLFQTQRYGTANGTAHTDFTYRFDDLPNGIYRVRVGLAEIQLGTTLSRTMEITGEGEWLLFRYLLSNDTRYTRTAVWREGLFRVCDNTLDVAFRTRRESSYPVIVNALAVEQVALPTSPDSTIRINAGATRPYTDSVGNVWLPDVNRCGSESGYHLGDGSFSSTATIRDQDGQPVADQALYRTERSGDPDPVAPYTYDQYFDYLFPNLAAGLYQLTLKEVELHYEQGSGSVRAFDILVNGAVVVDNLNILSLVPRNVALDLRRCVQLTSPGLRLHFRQEAWQMPDGTWRRQGHPKIGAFEIKRVDACTPSSP